MPSLKSASLILINSQDYPNTKNKPKLITNTFMKRFFAIAVVAITLASCAKDKEQAATVSYDFYGDTIATDVAFEPVEKIFATVSAENLPANVAIVGKSDAVCAKRGCWVSLNAGGENSLHVTFKDYGFFMPTNLPNGTELMLRGKFISDTTSVEELIAEAKEEGASEMDISAIIAPKINISFEATGVAIKKLNDANSSAAGMPPKEEN